jgi:hypothetical protein
MTYNSLHLLIVYCIAATRYIASYSYARRDAMLYEP